MLITNILSLHQSNLRELCSWFLVLDPPLSLRALAQIQNCFCRHILDAHKYNTASEIGICVLYIYIYKESRPDGYNPSQKLKADAHACSFFLSWAIDILLYVNQTFFFNNWSTLINSVSSSAILFDPKLDIWFFRSTNFFLIIFNLKTPKIILKI